MNKTKELYKAIASKDYASANQTLAGVMEVKAIERIKTILNHQEEK